MNTSRKLLIAGAALTAALAAASAASAQASATGTGTASVQVIQPLTISDDYDLSFGRVTTSAASGTVSVSEAGVVSTTAGVTAAGGTTSKGQFTASGEPNTAISVSLEGGGVLTLTGATSNTTLTGTFASSVAGASDTLSSAVGSSNLGTFVIPISATITIPANAASDSYTGHYKVDVAYN